MEFTRRPPLPCLEDMPWHVLRRIVVGVDAVDKLSLRSTSRTLKAVVDKAPKHYDMMEIKMNNENNDISITLTDDSSLQRQVTIIPNRFGYELTNPSQHWQKSIENDIFCCGLKEILLKVLGDKDVSLRVLCLELKQSKRLDTAEMILWTVCDVLEQRQGSKHLKVETIDFKMPIWNQEAIATILKHMQPNTLGTINLELTGNKPIHLEQLVALEQWKHAWKLVVQGAVMDQVPFDEWSHFECTQVSLDELSVEDFKGMLDIYRNHLSIIYSWIQVNKDDGLIDEHCRNESMTLASPESSPRAQIDSPGTPGSPRTPRLPRTIVEVSHKNLYFLKEPCTPGSPGFST